MKKLEMIGLAVLLAVFAGTALGQGAGRPASVDGFAELSVAERRAAIQENGVDAIAAALVADKGARYASGTDEAQFLRAWALAHRGENQATAFDAYSRTTGNKLLAASQVGSRQQLQAAIAETSDNELRRAGSRRVRNWAGFPQGDPERLNELMLLLSGRGLTDEIYLEWLLRYVDTLSPREAVKVLQKDIRGLLLNRQDTDEWTNAVRDLRAHRSILQDMAGE